MPDDRRGNAAKRVADVSAGPWKQCQCGRSKSGRTSGHPKTCWASVRTRHGRAVRFMGTYCRSPKGTGFGKPLVLAKFQKEWIEEALADGTETAILETPRGNGKSTMPAGLACWGGFDDDDTGAPQVPILATTVGQAILSVYGTISSMVQSEPELRRRALIYTGVAAPRILIPFNEGSIFPFANGASDADYGSVQGLDPSLAIIDEMGFQPMESYAALKMATGKRERSLIVGVGTPGLDTSNALYQIRKAVHERGHVKGVVFREFAADPGCNVGDRKQWRKANPAIAAGFLRMSALESDYELMPEGYFRIFRLGQWVEGVDSWLGPNGRAMWADLAAPYDFAAGAPTWVGIDVGLKRDSTAVVALQRDEAGHLHALAHFWLPDRDEPVDVTNVMQYVRNLRDAYQLEAVSFDPRFFDVPAKMLADEGLPMVEIPQSVEQMTRACGGLLELIKRGEVHHLGDDPTLTAHVLNAMPRYNEHGFTLQKSKSRGRIDGCIALALAADRVQRAEEAVPVPQFFF